MDQEMEEYYRKVRERRHRPTGTVIYDVTWGAKDKNGIPRYPGNADGHGHRIYIVLNGEEHTLIERQPDQDKRETATKELDEKEWEEAMNSSLLKEIEKAKETSDALVKKIELAARQGETGVGELSVEELEKRFLAIKKYGADWENELSLRVNSAKSQFERKKDERSQNRKLKEELILETEAFVGKGVYKNSDEALNDQMARWKQIGSAGTDADNELWEQFHNLRRDFYQKRREYFDEKRAQREQNEARKKELIEAEREAAADVSNYKEASQRINELFDRWKETGSAGRSADEKLWNEFNGIRMEFKKNRQDFYDRQKGSHADAAAKKEELLKKAIEVANTGDHGKENTEIMKSLNVQWKEAGSAGHETDERLWNEYRAVQDGFWESKHEEHAAARKEFTDKLEGAIERKQSQIDNLKNQIYHLKDKMHSVQNPGHLINMSKWIQEKETAIKELREQIEQMNKRL